MHALWLVMLLPLLAVFNGVGIPIAGSPVRADQLAACLLVVPLAAGVLIGARRLRVDRTMWWLAAILAANLVATALNSPARSYSLLQCASLASVWAIYALLANFLDTPAAAALFLRRILWAAIAGSAIGIGAFVLASLGLSAGGAEVSPLAAERLTRAFGAYGVMVEPNIFGSFTAATLVLSVVLLAGLPRDGSATSELKLAGWAAGLSAVGLVLSFTRAAWLGAILGLLCCAAAAGRGWTRRSGRLIKPLVAVATIVLLLLLAPGSAGALFRFKLLNLVNLQSQTAVLRLVTYSMALDQTIVHPIIGWGTFTFAPLAAQGTDFQQFENWKNLWIGNFALLALHDTGAVGLVLWCGMLWSVIGRGVRTAAALRPTDPTASLHAVALVGAVISLLVPFLTTTGFSLGYPWLLIGLLGAHAQLVPTKASAPEPAPAPAAQLPLPSGAT
ncbi:MAG: O-antigen ligase family protein [Gemmatimonadaceae bacterium]